MRRLDSRRRAPAQVRYCYSRNGIVAGAFREKAKAPATPVSPSTTTTKRASYRAHEKQEFQ